MEHNQCNITGEYCTDVEMIVIRRLRLGAASLALSAHNQFTRNTLLHRYLVIL